MESPNRLLQIEKRAVRILKTLCEQRELFALVDACDAPDVPEMCQTLGEERAVSLYSGEDAIDYAAIAPYLFQVDTAEVLNWLKERLEDEGGGLFVLAPNCDLETLCKHFRQFVIVQDPDGEEMYFRFYDPRVLSVFLPTCLPEEVRMFYGPVTAYGMVELGEEQVCWWSERPSGGRPSSTRSSL